MAFNIIVCAKQVPDTNVIKINPKTGTLIRDGVPSILNHDDANALEEALMIKDKFDDVHITVITMGPPQASDLLFECIAKGADEMCIRDRPVPYGCRLAGRGRIVRDTRRYFITEACIMDMAGDVLASGTVKYLRLDVDQIAEGAETHEELCYLDEDGVREISFDGRIYITR